jgi:uncharacterized repeat protein (TIGR01451 family)
MFARLEEFRRQAPSTDGQTELRHHATHGTQLGAIRNGAAGRLRWLKDVLDQVGGSAANRFSLPAEDTMDARRPQRTRRLPTLEHLEEKALLAPFMVMNTADSGAGSLRQAILDSNAAPPPAGSTNLIEFNIPTTDPGYNAASQSWTIAPQSSLPTVTAPAFINGYTQTGASPNTNPPGQGKNTILNIELNGGSAPVLLNGLTISAGNSTVSGLVINGCNIGIDLTGSGGDTIAGNFIGTDVTGKQRAGSNTGLELDSVGNVTIGGTPPGAGNVISGNLVGILSQQAAPKATKDLVEGNFIGTDVTGTQSAYQTNGVELANDSGDTIGGTTAAAGNLISGNTFHDISVGLGSQVSTDTVIQGNDFGTDVTGTSVLSNSFWASGGAAVELIGSGNTIGGAAAGAANIIADNGYNAVEVAQGTGNLISHNAIFGNTPGGIKLDSGANPGITAPVLATATVNPDDSVTVQGTLQNETPGDTITIELFASATNYVVGQEQGQSFVTSTTAPADSSGSASFSATVTLPAGEPYLTATATGSSNSTSAFSNSLSPGVGAPVDLALSDAVDAGPIAVGSNLGYTFTVANQGTTMATDVTLTHMLPASATFVSAVPSQGTATESAGTVTAALGDIAGGASATLRVLVQPQTIGSVEIAARVFSDQYNINPPQSVTSIPIDVSPPAPTNVAAQVVTGTGGSSAISLTWSYANPPGSTVTFNVYRSETSGGEGTNPYLTGLTTDQLTDPGAAPDHVYYYEVTAVLGGLESAHSGEAQCAILTAPTLSTHAFPANNIGSSLVGLTWSDLDPGAAGLAYVVTMGAPGGDTVVYQGTDPYYTIDQAPGTTRSYQVNAVVGSIEGPRSAQVPATTPDLLPPVLSVLSMGTPGPLGDVVVSLVWTNPYPSAMSGSSNLFRSASAGGEGTTPYQGDLAFDLATAGQGVGGGGGGGGNSGGEGQLLYLYTTVDQLPGSTYYYQVNEVVNVNDSNQPIVHSYAGPLSNEIAVTIPIPPDRRATVDNIFVNILKGLHKRTSNDIVINFSGALDAADAQDLAAYHLVTLGKLNKKTGQHVTKGVKLTSATYNAATTSVTLAIKGALPNQPLRLSISTSAVLDASGQPIAGTSGQSGGTFRAQFGKKGINLTNG